MRQVVRNRDGDFDISAKDIPIEQRHLVDDFPSTVLGDRVVIGLSLLVHGGEFGARRFRVAVEHIGADELLAAVGSKDRRGGIVHFGDDPVSIGDGDGDGELIGPHV